jgi:hypothetical protein
MTNIWYLDPVWTAILYNPAVDLTSRDDIKSCCNEFVKNVTVGFAGAEKGQIYLGHPTIKNGKIKTSHVYHPSIISADGKRLLTELEGGHPLVWKEKGLLHLDMGHLIISLGHVFGDIEASMKHYGFVPKDNTDSPTDDDDDTHISDSDEIEYIV